MSLPSLDRPVPVTGQVPAHLARHLLLQLLQLLVRELECQGGHTRVHQHLAPGLQVLHLHRVTLGPPGRALGTILALILRDPGELPPHTRGARDTHAVGGGARVADVYGVQAQPLVCILKQSNKFTGWSFGKLGIIILDYI